MFILLFSSDIWIKLPTYILLFFFINAKIIRIFLIATIHAAGCVKFQAKLKSPPPPYFKMLLLVKVLKFHNRPTVLT